MVGAQVAQDMPADIHRRAFSGFLDGSVLMCNYFIGIVHISSHSEVPVLPGHPPDCFHQFIDDFQLTQLYFDNAASDIAASRSSFLTPFNAASTDDI